MPEYQIPMSAAQATVQSNIPLQGDNRLPLATQPFEPIDQFANTEKAYKLADSMERFRADQDVRFDEQKIREEKRRDKMILDQYLQSGGDLYSPEGIEKATKELKGKISVDSYANLGKMADTKKKLDVEFKDALSRLDHDDLKLLAAKGEESIKMMMGPLSAYDEALKVGDQKKALEAFNASKQATLSMLGQQQDSRGNPVYAPQLLQQFEKMDPQQLRGQVQNSQFYQDRVAKEAEIRVKNNQARLYGNKADNEEKFGGIRGSSKISEIRRMVAEGEMTPEEGDRYIRSQLSGSTSPKGWKMTSAGGKVYRTNANEGKVQLQNEDGDWEDVSPKEMPQDLVESLGGKKAQSAITNRYNVRTITAAGEVLRNVDMIGMMPLGQTKGIFNYDPNGGLNSALKNKLTSEEAIDYNTALSGLSLELTTVLRNGMQLNEAEIANIEKGATANPGDSVANTRFKLANVIAKLKVAMENFEPSSEQQAKQKEDYLRQLEKYPTPEQVYAENQTGKLKVKTAGQSLEDTKKKADEKAGLGKIDKGSQSSRDEEAGMIRVKELGGLENAKLEIKQIDDVLRGAKGEGKRILETEKRMLEAGIKALATKSTTARDLPRRNGKGWVLHIDANGNRAYVGPKGEIEEVE